LAVCQPRGTDTFFSPLKLPVVALALFAIISFTCSEAPPRVDGPAISVPHGTAQVDVLVRSDASDGETDLLIGDGAIDLDSGIAFLDLKIARADGRLEACVFFTGDSNVVPSELLPVPLMPSEKGWVEVPVKQLGERATVSIGDIGRAGRYDPILPILFLQGYEGAGPVAGREAEGHVLARAAARQLTGEQRARVESGVGLFKNDRWAARFRLDELGRPEEVVLEFDVPSGSGSSIGKIRARFRYHYREVSLPPLPDAASLRP
jgi:hypothetical protein